MSRDFKVPVNATDFQIGSASIGRGYIAYAQVTANGTSVTNTSENDLTGLSVTVNVVANRWYRVSGYGIFGSATVDTRVILSIREGSTVLQQSLGTNRVAGSTTASLTLNPIYIFTAASTTSRTFKLSQRTAAAVSTTLVASTTNPAFIFVEDLGAAVGGGGP